MKRTKTTLPTFFTPPPPALELLSVSQYANGAAKDKQEVVTSNEAWVAGAFDIDLDHYLELYNKTFLSWTKSLSSLLCWFDPGCGGNHVGV